MPAGKRLPPGPVSRSPLGVLRDFASDVLGYHGRMRDEYGDLVRLRLGHRMVYLLNHPDLVHQVLVANHRNFIKHSFFWQHVRAIFGNGLLTNEGDSWLRQRRLTAPAFHRERVQSYGDAMVAYTARMVDRWEDGEVRNLHEDMMALTLEIVAKVLFDADVAADVQAVGRAFDQVTDEIAVRFRRPLPIPDWVPTPGNLRYRRGVRALDRLVYRIIAEHHASGARGNDLLSMLMQARDEDGSRMSDEQLRDETVTLLLAGHETTAIALSWTWYLLAQHPEAEQTLRRELEAVLGTRAASTAALPALRYAEAVIQESMRLYPPAYAIGREAVSDCTLGGYHVPAGTTVFISQWVMHRDARWFDEPARFRPERWLDGLADRLPRHVYMPFGGGPRICIGNSFAMMEAVLILVTVARRYRFTLAAGRQVEPFPTITLRPRGGVCARIQRCVPVPA